MSRPRSRVAAIVGIFVAALLITGASAAGADTTSPGSYHAKADATALELNVFGQGVTLGVTHAENSSDPQSAATGLGALVPVIGNQVEQTAAATAGAPSDSKPEVCGPISLPPEFPVVDLATACSAAAAAVTDGFPSSVGDAAVATVDVNANDVLGDVTSAVNEPIGDLLTDLQPVFDGLNEATGIDAQTLLNKIIEAITGGDLVRVTLGPSHSEAGATAATEFAQASAQGAVIEVLPRDLLELDPVLTIEVGAASNTITIDRATGLATVAYSPSIVTATLASDIATALGLSDAQRTVSVAPDQSQCLGLPAPLDSCITVAGGSQSTDDQGVTHANAAGVSLHLLTGVQDGIRLALAATSVEGVGALETSREAPPEEPPLARTGGTANTVLGAGLFAVAVGGMMLVRSTRRRYEIL